MQTDERHRDQAQGQMTFQRHITASLKVRQADLALGDAEHVLHVPADERRLQHAAHADASGRVGDEVFDVAGLPIPSQDQPMPGPAVVPQGHQHMTIKSGQRILWQGDVNINGTIATMDQVLP